MKKRSYTVDFGQRELIFELGEVAKQANGSVLVRYGDTVVLCTVAASSEAKQLDFFPLTVNYEERLYAAGKIPGGFIKREGRPTEFATLAARLIDRPLRPLFPEGFRNEVQVVATVLSVDVNNAPEIAAMVGASLALSISDIPFAGPIAGVKVGRVNGSYVINPTIEQMEASDIDLVVAGTKDAINMVEAGAAEVDEKSMLEAILFGHEAIKEIIKVQEKICLDNAKPKMDVLLYQVDENLYQIVDEKYGEKLRNLCRLTDKESYKMALNNLSDEILEQNETAEIKKIKEIIQLIIKEEVRRLITDEKIRPDGRKQTEIRHLSASVDFLPRTHGSALFQRGQTQALSVCTLGALNEYQKLDGLDLEESKRFMLHYNFPPYSVGETGRIGAAGRREIGHGALGERALKYVIPSEHEFPYTIRIVSEILESNGSTSQASICAGTMALMSAGVPIKAPVAGIAMGLVMKGENYTILTDIQGLEDHLGDMDFKVAGTEKGVTALQMDIKIGGITQEILKEALEQAKPARLQILEVMREAIKHPREKLSEYAPKVVMLTIDPEKIRDVIGPGGKQINAIIEQTDVKIDIEQDGSVFIYGNDEEKTNKAKQFIEKIVRVPIIGEIYLGKVVRIEKFGAFVEIYEGKDALVHISKLAPERIEKVEDVVKLGDTIQVKVTEVDDRGRVNAIAIFNDQKEA